MINGQFQIPFASRKWNTSLTVAFLFKSLCQQFTFAAKKAYSILGCN